MRHQRLTSEIGDQIAAYALGQLSSAEARAFELHLQAGCSICEEELRSVERTLSFLALSVPQSDPNPQLRERLLRQITGVSDVKDSPQVWKTWKTASARGQHLVRATQGSWEPVGLQGVLTKQLYVDPIHETVTMLVRMEPGATYPAHRHGGREQCFVLEGDLSYDIGLGAGDYLCAEVDTTHPISRTEHGCLLLIISSTHDDLLT